MSNWGEEPLDIYERAFGIIANASNGDWSKESEEWQEAAAEFRKDYHRELELHKLRETIRKLNEELDTLKRPCNETSIGGVVLEVVLERLRQNAKWGAEHDDTHADEEWEHYRKIRENRIWKNGNRVLQNRDDLIEIAALAVAQIESFDRFHHNLDMKVGM